MQHPDTTKHKREWDAQKEKFIHSFSPVLVYIYIPHYISMVEVATIANLANPAKTSGQLVPHFRSTSSLADTRLCISFI